MDMTDEIILVKPSSENEDEIRDYRDAFLMEDKKYSYIADRIPEQARPRIRARLLSPAEALSE